MRWQGTAYRAVNPRFPDPLSGQGAALFGGRFNRIGRPALYLSLRPETTLAETGGFGRLQPTLVVSFDADLMDIADGRDAAFLTRLGVDPRAMADPGWRKVQDAGGLPAGHALANALIAEGSAGLLVPSFQANPGGALNLVLWRWGPDLPHRLTLIDDDRRLTSPTPRGPA
jgi:RES domain-containing protein